MFYHSLKKKFRLIGLVFAIFSILTSCTADSQQTEIPPFTPTQPTFHNVADEVGIDFQHGAFRWGFSGDPVAMMGGGLCWIDYNNDGWLDLYVVNSYAVAEAGKWESETGSLPRNAFYHNDEGQFSEEGAATGTDLAMRGNGCVAADLNLDGYSDLYITSSRFNVLLWNNGDGTFSDGGRQAGVDTYGWQTAVSVGDLNADGLPDIFTAGYVDVNNQIEGSTMGFPNTHYGRPDLVFINQGIDESGYATFREVHELVGLIEFDPDSEFEYGLGSTLSDVDNDGDLDLFVANDTNPNRLYINEQMANDPEGIGFRLVESGATAQIDDINSGMGVASGDFDQDGRFDLFITNLGNQLHSVYRNTSESDASATFADATSNMGITDIGVGWTGWGATWADFDLDSDLDLFVVNGRIPVIDFSADAMLTQLYANQTAQGEQGQFSNMSSEAGLEEIGKLVGRGSAVADFDNDGDLDIAVATIGGELRLLRNDGATGNWLQVQLQGFAPGAIITATLIDGTELRCELKAGSSYLASEDPRCHFGLGAADSVRRLYVRWPNGEETVLQNVEANQVVIVERG